MRNLIAGCFFILGIGAGLFAQKLDSLALSVKNGPILLVESDIISWDWSSQSILLNELGMRRLGSTQVIGERWELMIGEHKVLEGFFLDREPIESATDSIFLDFDSKKGRVVPPVYNRLILWYFPSKNVHRRNQDWRINPLFNPILLQHLLNRNLIPAEYRMRVLFRTIGLPWPRKS